MSPLTVYVVGVFAGTWALRFSVAALGESARRGGLGGVGQLACALGAVGWILLLGFIAGGEVALARTVHAQPSKRMVERQGERLENRWPPRGGPWVRIPPPPLRLQRAKEKPRRSGA
jgi:hypothetical protein